MFGEEMGGRVGERGRWEVCEAFWTFAWMIIPCAWDESEEGEIGIVVSLRISIHSA